MNNRRRRNQRRRNNKRRTSPQNGRRNRRRGNHIGKIIAIAASAVGVLGVCIGVFFCVKLFAGREKYDENNVGEISFHETAEEHIATENSIMFADNELLVVAEDGVSRKKMEQLAEKYSAEVVGCIEQTGDYQWLLTESYTMEELDALVEEVQGEEQVHLASLNYFEEVTENRAPYDVNVGDQWRNDLSNDTDNNGLSWGVEAIHAPAAWDLLAENSERVNPIKVGLIDNRFDTEHEDLSFAETFYNPTSAFPSDKKIKEDLGGYGHGTHVAGILAADATDNTGICGVYPYGAGNLYGVSTNGVRSISENRSDFRVSMLHLKISYAELILRDVKVINNSQGFNYLNENNWGIGGHPTSGKKWEERRKYLNENSYILGDFLDRLIQKGYDFCIITAAGNDHGRYDAKYNWWNTVISKTDYPEVYDRIIVVGAIDDDFFFRESSNRGGRVDLYAPGGNIYSTVPGKGTGTYDTMSGTSMASPHVAGVAAMVWSANSKLTGKLVKEIITNSCTYVDDEETGDLIKIVNAEKAVTNAFSHYQNVPSETHDTNGAIMSFVYDNRTKNKKPVTDVTVYAIPVSEGQGEIKPSAAPDTKLSATPDIYGHFELVVPDGFYRLQVHSNLPSGTKGRFDDFILTTEREVSEGVYESTNTQLTIKVKNGEVDYNRWIFISDMLTNLHATGRTEDGQEAILADAIITVADASGATCFTAQGDIENILEEGVDGWLPNGEYTITASYAGLESEPIETFIGNGLVDPDLPETIEIPLRGDFPGLTFDMGGGDVVAIMEYDSHIYALYDYGLSWHSTALTSELSKDVHMVTITDEMEQNAIENLIWQGGRILYYIGATVNSEGQLEWVTGEPASYVNWASDSPSEYAYIDANYEDVVAIYCTADDDFGKWVDFLEDNSLSYFDVFDDNEIKTGVILEFEGISFADMMGTADVTAP